MQQASLAASAMMASADSAERTARAALAAHAVAGEIADAPFRPIRGGLSNHAWRVDHAGGGYFVRLGSDDAESLGVDRRSECSLLAAVSAAGLAPEVLVCDPGAGLLVTRFMLAATWTRQDAREVVNLRRMGVALRNLHSLPPRPGIRRVGFAAQARFLEGQLGAEQCVQPALRRVAATAFDLLAAREPIVSLCHNDLHHLNILDDGERLWLVDWEYGGCGDPLFDLASFLCQHQSTSEEREVLLTAYAGDAGISSDLVEGACRAFDYVQWLWFRLRGMNEPGEAGAHLSRAEVIARRLLSGAAR
jgi:thiamine kinase-like enzyme